MKTVDYPACHSMDTTWFAVDKDGNVAILESGEGGAIPLKSDKEAGFSDFLEDHAQRITNNLFSLNINDELIEHIISKCGKLEKVEEYASGFIILKEGTVWADLHIDMKDWSYAVQLSKEKRLYYFEDSDTIPHLNKAIDDGKILSGLITTSIEWTDADNYENSSAQLLGFYYYESDFYGPYRKACNVKKPLKYKTVTKNLNTDSPDNVEHFDMLSFNDTDDFYPMEYVSGRVYTVDSETSKEELDAGYLRLTKPNGKDYLFALSNEYNTSKKLDIYRYNDCNHQLNLILHSSFTDKYKKYYYHEVFMKSDYPRVLVLSDYTKRCDKQHKLPKILQLGIPIFDYYKSYCVKCALKYDDKEHDFKYLQKRFNNCYKKVVSEAEMLHIQLVICLNTNAYKLMSSKFEVIKNNGELDTIIINKKPYAFLDLLSHKPNESEINEIAKLLKTERVLPNKQRVIEL